MGSVSSVRTRQTCERPSALDFGVSLTGGAELHPLAHSAQVLVQGIAFGRAPGMCDSLRAALRPAAVMPVQSRHRFADRAPACPSSLRGNRFGSPRRRHRLGLNPQAVHCARGRHDPGGSAVQQGSACEIFRNHACSSSYWSGFRSSSESFSFRSVTYAVRRPTMKWKMKDRTARTSST